MFEMLKPNERYIIGGYIKRGDNTVLDIAVEAIDTPGSIRQAINHLRADGILHSSISPQKALYPDLLHGAHSPRYSLPPLPKHWFRYEAHR